MTAEELAAQIHFLIERAREGGLPDEVIIAGPESAAEASDEGLG